MEFTGNCVWKTSHTIDASVAKRTTSKTLCRWYLKIRRMTFHVISCQYVLSLPVQKELISYVHLIKFICVFFQKHTVLDNTIHSTFLHLQIFDLNIWVKKVQYQNDERLAVPECKPFYKKSLIYMYASI